MVAELLNSAGNKATARSARNGGDNIKIVSVLAEPIHGCLYLACDTVRFDQFFGCPDTMMETFFKNG
jgi:hypothetical protein